MRVYAVIPAMNYEMTVKAHEHAGLNNILYSVIDIGSGRSINGKDKELTEDELKKKYPYQRPRIADKYQKILKTLVPRGVSFFLDSGAYQMKEHTAYISIDEYVDFIRCYGRKFDVIVGLDVIGDTAKSIENYKYMIKNGADHDNFIMTWHAGQPVELLEKIMTMSDYVGLGGLAKGYDIIARIKHMEKGVNLIRTKDPKIRIHLFGTGRPWLIRRFADRVYSCDATSWNIAEKFGQLLSLSGQKTLNYYGRLPTKNADIRHQTALYNVYKMTECNH